MKTSGRVGFTYLINRSTFNLLTNLYTKNQCTVNYKSIEHEYTKRSLSLYCINVKHFGVSADIFSLEQN